MLDLPAAYVKKTKGTMNNGKFLPGRTTNGERASGKIRKRWNEREVALTKRLKKLNGVRCVDGKGRRGRW